MNPVRIFLQMMSSPSAGPRLVAMTLAVLFGLAVVFGVIYGYHYWEAKKKRQARRRRRRRAAEVARRELTQEDVEGDVW